MLLKQHLIDGLIDVKDTSISFLCYANELGNVGGEERKGSPPS